MTTPPSADRNLLFGILAVQMDFVTQSSLIKAMNAWVLNKSRPLGELLVSQGALSAERRTLLEALVEEHLKQHNHEVSESLRAVSSVTSACEALGQIEDQDVQASLAGFSLRRPSGTTQRPQGKAADTLASPMPTISVNVKSLPGFRYQILRPHAKGGLGEVLVARDQELHREVALKQIQEGRADDPESQARFLIEAEITGGLEHPGIVPVYGLGYYDDGRPYYAMRFIRGDSLKEAIARYHQKSADDVEDTQATEPLQPEQKAGWNCRGRSQTECNLELRGLLRRFIDVCNAIAYAHSRGVLHRDLKPGNIMLGKYGETLVVDWGLAKPQSVAPSSDAVEPQLEPPSVSGTAQTLMGSAVGTPQYMSPEQAAGRLNQLGPASDVYSLGATLYCLLTGKAPFQGRDVGAMLKRVQNGEFPPPRQIDRRIPSSLEAICLKAMALEPKNRYASPRDLAEDIENWLADEPVTAHRDTLYEQICRWSRRHKPWVMAGTLLLLTAVLGLTGSNILINQERERTQEALAETERSKQETEDALTKAQAAEAARLEAQVNALLQAESDSVPIILTSLEPVRDRARPLLEAHLQSENLSPARIRRIHLALLPDQPELLDELQAELLKADAEEFAMLREGLMGHREELKGPLWDILLEEKADAKIRFRAACALAAFDPNDSQWPALADQVTTWLVAENPLVLGTWVEMLDPVRAALLPSLARLFRESTVPEVRSVANTVVGRWAADQMELLAGLLKDADPSQFAALILQLRERKDEALAYFQAALKETLAPKWPKNQEPWPNPQPRFAEQIEQAEGLITDTFALVQNLPLEQFSDLVDGLEPAGYRPARYRPYSHRGKILVAAYWERDNKPFAYETSLTKDALLEKHKAHQEAGFAAVDASGYLSLPDVSEEEPAPERYGAIWVQSDLKPEETVLLSGLDSETFEKTIAVYQRQSSPHGMMTLQSFEAGSKTVRHTALMQIRPQRRTWNSVWSATEQKFEIKETPSWVQTDISLMHLSEPPTLHAPFQEELDALSGTDLEGGLGLSYIRPYKEGLIALGEGRNQQAVESFTQALNVVQLLPQPFYLRSLAQARLGNMAEARADAKEGSEVLARAVPLLTAEQARDCYYEAAYALPQVFVLLGEPKAGETHLEEFLAAHENQSVAHFTAARAYAAMSKTVLEKKLALEGEETSKDPEALAMRFANRAVALLESAFRNGLDDGKGMLFTQPDLEPLREMPAYRKLVEDQNSMRRFAAVWHLGQITSESQRTKAGTFKEHLAQCQALAAKGFRPVAISVSAPTRDALGNPLDEARQDPVAISVWQRPLLSEEDQNRHARQQANSALALWHLEPDQDHWPLIQAVNQPGFEAKFIKGTVSMKLPPRHILDRLAKEDNSLARRMLILALGQYDTSQLPEADRQALVPMLAALYRDDPDSGIHSASEWLLRKWNQQSLLKPINESLKTNRPREGKAWYTNGQGQTLSVIQGPVEFQMGSAPTDQDQWGDELRHIERIERSFAISTTETTVAQYLRFNPEADYVKTSSPDPEGPMINVDWFAAMKYCRWLSEQEGIPDDQMCYPPVKEIGPSMTIPADYLKRTGYRLPTEAEWEYAARAGMPTKFTYGDDPELLSDYGWFKQTANDRAHPVGLLIPNRLGLFDVMGNAGEWCHDEYLAFDLPPDGLPRLDTPPREVNGNRVGKGGSLLSDPYNCRLSRRFTWQSLDHYRDVGFRVVRTLPAASEVE